MGATAEDPQEARAGPYREGAGGGETNGPARVPQAHLPIGDCARIGIDAHQQNAAAR